MSEKAPETGEQAPRCVSAWVGLKLGLPNPRSTADRIMRKEGARLALAHDQGTDAQDLDRLHRTLVEGTNGTQEKLREVGYKKARLETVQVPIAVEDGSSRTLNVFRASGLPSEQTTIAALQGIVERTNIQLKVEGSDLRVPDVNLQPKDTMTINFAANEQH